MVTPGPRLSPGTPVCLCGHGGSSRGAPGVAAGTMAAVPCALNGPILAAPSLLPFSPTGPLPATNCLYSKPHHSARSPHLP